MAYRTPSRVVVDARSVVHPAFGAVNGAKRLGPNQVSHPATSLRPRGQHPALEQDDGHQSRLRCTANVVSPARPQAPSDSDEPEAGPSTSSVLRLTPDQTTVEGPETSLAEVMAPVREDVELLNKNLRTIVGERHPMLMAAADQIFGAGGKKLRPVISFLVARATLQLGGLSDLTDKHRRLAEITEMIHVASLVHDDVLDDCSIRRGKATVNTVFGTRVAVLAGDFLFAQASWGLANLENLEVIKLISQVIADFANGEISQATSLFDASFTLDQYLSKSFYKTASLMAASCKCAAVFSNVSTDTKEALYDYGKHLGLAFQIVDDILDFTQSTEQLGKPQGQDLASGNLTAPAIFALRNKPELAVLLEEEFAEEGSLEQAIELVKQGGGIAAARDLAAEEGDKARAALACLPESSAKASLMKMVDYVLERLY